MYTGENQRHPYNVEFGTLLALVRGAIPNAASDATPDDASNIDLSHSRIGLNNKVALYTYSDGTHSLDVQLWVDISAQGAATRKWVKLGTPVSFAGGAGEGGFHLFSGIPSGLLAVQLLNVTTSDTIDVFEQHTI